MPAVTLPGRPDSLTPIRDGLDQALTNTLAKPVTGRGRLEATVATSGARIEAVQKLRGSWVVGGWAGLAWGGKPEAGIRVGGSW